MMLSWQDHAIVIVYLLGMILLGAYLSRKQSDDDEYFLASRNMPWFAVGMSIIASLLSSLTYLSEPGEVWRSGLTQFLGKMLAIPLEMFVVFLFCVPFMMRFRFTSAYEYLEYRFGRGTRRLGVAFFLMMVVLWMGFVVFASALALATVTKIDLIVVIVTVGAVATIYTMLGGLRAVIWTDVIQVTLLIGGGVCAIGFVAIKTGTWLPDWYDSVQQWLAHAPREGLQSGQRPPTGSAFFSADPFVRTTVVTFALSMTVWHICTHIGNQMTVQRLLQHARHEGRAAELRHRLDLRRIAELHADRGGHGHFALLRPRHAPGADGVMRISLDGKLDAMKRADQDLIFSTFAVRRLPAGIGGGILAALLAAAMSSIDSGINSIATVLAVEMRTHERTRRANHVKAARIITLLAGAFITVAAYSLSYLPKQWGIIDAMPRTFNAITPALGSLFLIGMFMPRVGGRAMVAAAFCGVATSIILGYSSQIGELLQNNNLLGGPTDPSAPAIPAVSFTWIMPCSLLATFVLAYIFSFFDRSAPKDLAGLTWYRRHEPTHFTHALSEADGTAP